MVISLSWRACHTHPTVSALGLFSVFDGKDQGRKSGATCPRDQSSCFSCRCGGATCRCAHARLVKARPWVTGDGKVLRSSSRLVLPGGVQVALKEPRCSQQVRMLVSAPSVAPGPQASPRHLSPSGGGTASARLPWAPGGLGDCLWTNPAHMRGSADRN